MIYYSTLKFNAYTYYYSYSTIYTYFYSYSYDYFNYYGYKTIGNSFFFILSLLRRISSKLFFVNLFSSIGL